MRIEFDGLIFMESETYVAHCPELDVSSCGATIEEARNNLKTAVRLFLEETERMGTLEDILHIKNNLRTAGITREQFFSLIDEV